MTKCPLCPLADDAVRCIAQCPGQAAWCRHATTADGPHLLRSRSRQPCPGVADENPADRRARKPRLSLGAKQKPDPHCIPCQKPKGPPPDPHSPV